LVEKNWPGFAGVRHANRVEAQISALQFAYSPHYDFKWILSLKGEEFSMPIFEYVCKECDHQFEALIYGDGKAACPKCQSKKLTQQLSVFAMAAKSSASSPAPVGACGSCGDPRGPGACSMPDMD
jgi:putative FmdB family regulatory protein